jgi:hypothetical protein
MLLFTSYNKFQPVSKPKVKKQQEEELVAYSYDEYYNNRTQETLRVEQTLTRPVKKKEYKPLFHENFVKIGYDVYEIYELLTPDYRNVKVNIQEIIVVDGDQLAIKKDFFGNKILVKI